MMIQAVLGNPNHPEYGVATIPLPIPHDQYAHCMELLEALEIGDAVKVDCKVEKIDSFYTVLKRTEMLTVNVEELNYLAKRLDSFDTGEAAQFQAMAHKLELFELKDLINLTFCCQQATVITDFSDLAAIGRDHYMNLHGGSASVDELNKLDGEETARQLIESGSGTVTPYGVVYDNGMKLEQIYDGQFFPCYYYKPNVITVAVTSKAEPEDTEHITWLFLPTVQEEIDRALLRGGITDPADVRLRLESSQLPDEVDVLLDMEYETLADLDELAAATDGLSKADKRSCNRKNCIVNTCKALRIVEMNGERSSVLLQDTVIIGILIAGFLHELLCLFHVGRIGLNLHTAVGLFIRKEGFGSSLQTIENRGFQLLLINSVGYCFPYKRIIKGSLIQVHTQITSLVGAVIHGMTESGILGYFRVAFCAKSAGAENCIDFAVAQSKNFCSIIRNHFDFELVHFRSFAPVVGIADKGIGISLDPVKHIGTSTHSCTHAILVSLFYAAFKGCGIHNTKRQRHGQIVKSSVIRGLQSHYKGFFIRGFQLVKQSSELTEGTILGTQIGYYCFKGHLYCLGSQRSTVRKFDTITQMEGVSLAVITDFPGFSQLALDLPVIIVAYQSVVKITTPESGTVSAGYHRRDDRIEAYRKVPILGDSD